MTVLITGASGFVGRHMQKYLEEEKHEVRSLSLRSEGWQQQTFFDAEVVIHLAGKAHDTSNTSSDAEYFKVNRDLTIELFNSFLESHSRDFFYFSSVKAAADTVDGALTEDMEEEPFTPYGKSKLEAEKYILSQTIPAGKRVFIIRPCMMHGPENKGNLNLLYKVVEKAIPWPLAAFQNQRSFLSIDNLNYIIRRLIEDENIKSGVYNVADDESLSTNELVSLISKTLNRKPRLWHIPPGLIKAVVKIGDVVPLPLNSERLQKLTESYVVSNTKIKQALGLEKLPLSAKEGLEKTIRSFKS